MLALRAHFMVFRYTRQLCSGKNEIGEAQTDGKSDGPPEPSLLREWHTFLRARMCNPILCHFVTLGGALCEVASPRDRN
jgi:hypothetical protein